MILTSNQSFAAWGDVFGDRVIATAILDRLLHHAVTLNIRGNSYRLKEKLRAGLVLSLDDNGSQPGGEIWIAAEGKIEMSLTVRAEAASRSPRARRASQLVRPAVSSMSPRLIPMPMRTTMMTLESFSRRSPHMARDRLCQVVPAAARTRRTAH